MLPLDLSLFGFLIVFLILFLSLRLLADRHGAAHFRSLLPLHEYVDLHCSSRTPLVRDYCFFCDLIFSTSTLLSTLIPVWFTDTMRFIQNFFHSLLSLSLSFCLHFFTFFFSQLFFFFPSVGIFFFTFISTFPALFFLCIYLLPFFSFPFSLRHFSFTPFLLLLYVSAFLFPFHLRVPLDVSFVFIPTVHPFLPSFPLPYSW